MAHTHKSGTVQDNTPLRLLFVDEINRMNKSCCGADGFNSPKEGSKDNTRRMCMIRQTNPIGVQYDKTPLGFVSRINLIRWMHSLKDHSADEMSHRTK
jgi:hypothetical protein